MNDSKPVKSKNAVVSVITERNARMQRVTEGAALEREIFEIRKKVAEEELKRAILETETASFKQKRAKQDFEASVYKAKLSHLQFEDYEIQVLFFNLLNLLLTFSGLIILFYRGTCWVRVVKGSFWCWFNK